MVCIRGEMTMQSQVNESDWKLWKMAVRIVEGDVPVLIYATMKIRKK